MTGKRISSVKASRGSILVLFVAGLVVMSLGAGWAFAQSTGWLGQAGKPVGFHNSNSASDHGGRRMALSSGFAVRFRKSRSRLRFVDTPPETTITSQPVASTTETAASFSFASSEGGSTFACKLDGAGWGGCSSPKGYSSLGLGEHTFSVRATDGAGNVDSTPASGAWTVQASTPPPAGTHCYSSPHTCGYPDETNTGVPAGTTLTNSGSITASTNGQIINALNLTGSITVTADNVTIRNSKLHTTSGGNGARVITLNNGADNFTLEDSEVYGNGSTTNAPESAVWNHYNNSGARVIRSFLHGSPDNWEGRVDLVKDSYMVVDAAFSGSHDENIYVCSTTVNVDHSTLINQHGQTATVFGDTICGGGNSFTVTNSLLAGGGYVVYPQANSTNPSGAKTVITGNRIARCTAKAVYNSGSGGTTCQGGPDSNGLFPYGGYYGMGAYFSGPVTWTGNVWDDNLATIPEP